MSAAAGRCSDESFSAVVAAMIFLLQFVNGCAFGFDQRRDCLIADSGLLELGAGMGQLIDP
ncbi:hypothetical protein [Alloacidobacterium sp.]|uniref:hypothetical protein n=1 Tax=Alloacidobacterium sp. TaxID=2951999 RepID=UPI002D6206C3|nr:hypothetical protein [Alloacidobacterium sp.]HYK34714.1 hypothetical protein [Alloacidobacterium sp.]